MKVMRNGKTLTEEWEVIRYDIHETRFRFQRNLSEEEAKEMAEKKNQPNQFGHKHHQTFEARPYDPNDRWILG